MKNRKNVKRFAALALAALLATPVFAVADVTGKWSGPLVMTFADQTRNDTLNAEFKQTGADLTGTAAPQGDTNPAPLKGKVDGNKVTFDVTTEGPIIHFDLTLADGHLKGTISAEFQGQKMTGTVDLQTKK